MRDDAVRGDDGRVSKQWRTRLILIG